MSAVTQRIDAIVRERGGRCTVDQIVRDLGPGTRASIVHTAIRHLGFVKVRPTGAKRYDPAVVYHPDMAPYVHDRVAPHVDTWVRRAFDVAGGEPILTATLLDDAQDAGFSRSETSTALKRLRCSAELIAGRWHRQAPGTVPASDAPEMPDELASAAAQRIVFAVLDQLATPLPPGDVTTLALDALGVDPGHPAVADVFNPVVSAMWDHGYLAPADDALVERGPASAPFGFAPSVTPSVVAQ